MSKLLFYLVGFPGTGKKTIGKEIVKLRDEFCLVDAHLINNPVFQLLRLDGKTPLLKQTWTQVGKIWDVVLESIRDLAPQDQSYIFTNYLKMGDVEDQEWFDEIEALANYIGAKFVPVFLEIDLEEHKARITSQGRILDMKETNPNAPLRYAAEELFYKDTEYGLRLNVSNLTAEDAAKVVLEHALI